MRLYIISALVRLKVNYVLQKDLKSKGIDISEYMDNITNLIEEGVCYLLTKEDSAFDSCLSDIQWWLEDSKLPKKIIRLNMTPPKKDLDVTDVSTFVDFLIETYNI